MSIAIFLITHEGIASSLLNIGKSIIQKPIDNISFIEVPMDTEVDVVTKNIETKISTLNLSDGIIFITDIYGSTPANIAKEFATNYDTSLLSGINLPMIIRLLSYRDEDSQTILKKALEGACQGIHINN
jgi:PTS system ascorbate-specific IIA component